MQKNRISTAQNASQCGNVITHNAPGSVKTESHHFCTGMSYNIIAQSKLHVSLQWSLIEFIQW